MHGHQFTDRFGWSVKIKSIQEALLVCLLVIFFNWENAFEEVDENNFDPSVVLMHLGHQKEDLALKSPVITQKYGLCLLMSLKKFLKNRQK